MSCASPSHVMQPRPGAPGAHFHGGRGRWHLKTLGACGEVEPVLLCQQHQLGSPHPRLASGTVPRAVAMTRCSSPGRGGQNEDHQEESPVGRVWGAARAQAQHGLGAGGQGRLTWSWWPWALVTMSALPRTSCLDWMALVLHSGQGCPRIPQAPALVPSDCSPPSEQQDHLG